MSQIREDTLTASHWTLCDDETHVQQIEWIGGGGFGDVFKVLPASLNSSSRTIDARFPKRTGPRHDIDNTEYQSFARKLVRTTLKGNLDNEVRAINKLCKTSHPHIVQVLRHGFLKVDRTFYFFDMELCHANLAKYIKGDATDGLENWCILRKQMDFAFHVFDILEQIVDGLIFIHGHQEVHRDLHPENGESLFSATDNSAPIVPEQVMEDC